MAIRRRIIKGYAMVLGVALTGIISGVVTGHQGQQKALALRRITTHERKLLSDLGLNIHQNRPAHQFSSRLSDPAAFKAESEVMLGSLENMKQLISRHYEIHQEIASHHITSIADKVVTSQISQATLERSPTTIAMENLEEITLDLERTAIRNLHDSLLNFEITLDALQVKAQAFVDGYLASPPTNATELHQAQESLLALVASAEFKAFVAYPAELVSFSDEVSSRERLAEESFLQAQVLRNRIIAISVVISMVLGTVMAVITSRAIAEPISRISTFSQAVTKVADFNQTIDIKGDIEIETLAASLNHLIRQVHVLLETIGQKNTELELAFEQLQLKQTQIVQAEKMSSLGQLVAGVAHEINNPVGFIHSNVYHSRNYLTDLLELLQLYQHHYPDPHPEIADQAAAIDLDFLVDDFPKVLDSMTLGTKRIRDIVNSLRNFSRMDHSAFKEVNIHDGIDSTLVILFHRLKPKPKLTAIKIDKQYGDLPFVECFPSQLNQVFMNILSNAIDALEESRCCASQYQQSTQQAEIVPTISIHTKIVNHDHIEIRFRDNGPGIAAEVLPKVFNPFFTTKEIGKGTGLGMSISYQIVTESHGGTIRVESKEGQGTEFIIQIPMRHNEAFVNALQAQRAKKMAIAP